MAFAVASAVSMAVLAPGRADQCEELAPICDTCGDADYQAACQATVDDNNQDVCAFHGDHVFARRKPGAVADAKALCLALSRDRIDDQHAFTSESLADRWETEEAQEGIRCFFDGEKPSWSRKRSGA